MSQLDKNKIAFSFSKAAKTYDAAAAFQREVGEELLDLISVNQTKPINILDLGCGTGFFSEKLVSKFSRAKIFGLDIAHGMLQYAQARRVGEKICWLCGDAENLPVQDESIDLIFSSLAVQWCENLPDLFGEISRILRPGGEVVMSTLGPNSLCELKQAWASVDNSVHVNNFIALDSILSHIPIGLDASVLEKKWTLEYDNLKQLTSDLKNIGAHNINRGKSKGLTGRKKIEALKGNYEKIRQSNGKLPASYDVYLLKLTKQ